MIEEKQSTVLTEHKEGATKPVLGQALRSSGQKNFLEDMLLKLNTEIQVKKF